MFTATWTLVWVTSATLTPSPSAAWATVESLRPSWTMVCTTWRPSVTSIIAAASPAMRLAASNIRSVRKGVLIDWCPPQTNFRAVKTFS